ncbi:MAG: hypothetical protein EP305_04260 [Bacteroidetes bacterium]|nr:MAG: hypothetical protein EP305_04260 [Bacteroidota bacterium]
MIVFFLSGCEDLKKNNHIEPQSFADVALSDLNEGSCYVVIKLKPVKNEKNKILIIQNSMLYGIYRKEYKWEFNKYNEEFNNVLTDSNKRYHVPNSLKEKLEPFIYGENEFVFNQKELMNAKNDKFYLNKLNEKEKKQLIYYLFKDEILVRQDDLSGRYVIE